MKLYEACKLAKEAGLTTVGEAILNIALHYNAFFPVKDFANEMRELRTEVANHGANDSTPIEEILAKGEGWKWT